MMRLAGGTSRRRVLRILLATLVVLLLAVPRSGRAVDTSQLDQARIADMYVAQAQPAPAAQPADKAPAPEKEAEKELKTLTVQLDKSGDQLMQSLNGRLRPWMWWVVCGAWVLLVILVTKLIEFAYRRFFPGRRISWLGRIFRVFCYLIAALIAVFLFLHGFGASSAAEPVLHIEGKLIVLAAAFGVAGLALLAVNITIDRYLMTTDAMGQPMQRSPRVLTLLPLLRNIAMITLGVMLVLMVLGQFGVNIAPLLAGAGVVGVAIGFGSQKLVQDVITGAFMLFENTMAIGDTVQIGTNTGTVESMTIRTIRIRDGSGQLHTLPFSSVTTVVNMSRDYAFFNFTLRISYESSVDKAIQVISQTVAEMRADPSIAPDILSFADIVGVNALTDLGAELAGSIKVPPLRQYTVGPIFNRRIKEAFDREGIKFATPYREIRLVQDQPRTDSAS